MTKAVFPDCFISGLDKSSFWAALFCMSVLMVYSLFCLVALRTSLAVCKACHYLTTYRNVKVHGKWMSHFCPSLADCEKDPKQLDQVKEPSHINTTTLWQVNDPR